MGLDVELFNLGVVFALQGTSEVNKTSPRGCIARFKDEQISLRINTYKLVTDCDLLLNCAG